MSVSACEDRASWKEAEGSGEKKERESEERFGGELAEWDERGSAGSDTHDPDRKGGWGASSRTLAVIEVIDTSLPAGASGRTRSGPKTPAHPEKSVVQWISSCNTCVDRDPRPP